MLPHFKLLPIHKVAGYEFHFALLAARRIQDPQVKPVRLLDGRQQFTAQSLRTGIRMMGINEVIDLPVSLSGITRTYQLLRGIRYTRRIVRGLATLRIAPLPAAGIWARSDAVSLDAPSKSISCLSLSNLCRRSELRMMTPLRYCLLLIMPFAMLRGENWMEWRGNDGNGIVRPGEYPTSWSATENILWTAELPAPGNSSPIVHGDRVFVTCANDDGTERGLYCFDRKTGKTLWSHSLPYNTHDPTHPTNPWCAPSPATDGESVFVWNGSAGAAAYDFNGNLLWQRDLGEFAHQWGHASSPRLFEDTVIVFGSPGPRVILTALNKRTGETVWQREFSDIASPPDELHGSFATPLIWNNGPRTELLLPLPGFLASFDPESGNELWRCRGLGALTYTDPIVSSGLILAFSGFKGPAMGMRQPGADETGDLTESHRIWLNETVEQRVGSGVIVDGRYYLAGRKGPLKCGDIRTGEIIWTYDLGEQCWSSVSYSQGLLYLTDQASVTRIFKPGDSYQEIASNEMNPKERGNSTIAFDNGQLFLRTNKALYAIEDR